MPTVKKLLPNLWPRLRVAASMVRLLRLWNPKLQPLKLQRLLLRRRVLVAASKVRRLSNPSMVLQRRRRRQQPWNPNSLPCWMPLARARVRRRLLLLLRKVPRWNSTGLPGPMPPWNPCPRKIRLGRARTRPTKPPLPPRRAAAAAAVLGLQIVLGVRPIKSRLCNHERLLRRLGWSLIRRSLPLPPLRHPIGPSRSPAKTTSTQPRRVVVVVLLVVVAAARNLLRLWKLPALPTLERGRASWARMWPQLHRFNPRVVVAAAVGPRHPPLLCATGGWTISVPTSRWNITAVRLLASRQRPRATTRWWDHHVQCRRRHRPRRRPLAQSAWPVAARKRRNCGKPWAAVTANQIRPS
jgi:hypothetical protein